MDLNELQSLNIRELSKLAQKLNIDGGIAGLNRQALIIKILEQVDSYTLKRSSDSKKLPT